MCSFSRPSTADATTWKCFGSWPARAEWNHADALAHLFCRVIPGGEHRRKTLLERADLRAQQPGLEVLEEMLHREERLRLARIEPESGQLVLGRECLGLHEPVAARIAVPLDGRVVAALHVFEVALEGRQRHLQLAHELRRGDRAACAQHLLDLVETLATVHAGQVHARKDICGVAHLVSFQPGIIPPMNANHRQPPPPPREPACSEPTISLESLLLQDLKAWMAAKEAIARAARPATGSPAGR
jgi:hypothetical protein